MRAVFIVFVPPILDFPPGVVKRKKPVRLQTFIAEAAIERLDHCIICRLAGPGKLNRNSLPVSQKSRSFDMNSGPL